MARSAGQQLFGVKALQYSNNWYGFPKCASVAGRQLRLSLFAGHGWRVRAELVLTRVTP